MLIPDDHLADVIADSNALVSVTFFLFGVEEGKEENQNKTGMRGKKKRIHQNAKKQNSKTKLTVHICLVSDHGSAET